MHFALNVVLGDRKRIVAAFAGPPLEVMRQGMPCVRSLNQVEVGLPFDLMLVSPGGHPKDTNVYQAQKALAHAALVTRPGGTILLAAACPDGTGSSTYEDWMSREDMTSHEAVIARFTREGYAIGPHKAFQISRDASRFRVALHSEMPARLSATCSRRRPTSSRRSPTRWTAWRRVPHRLHAARQRHHPGGGRRRRSTGAARTGTGRSGMDGAGLPVN